MSEVAQDYKKAGTRIRLVTSAPSFIYGLSASKNWMMVRKPSRTPNTAPNGILKGTTSVARLTASFEFVG